jgi:hypothetical protein
MTKTTAARMMRALVGGVAADWQVHEVEVP